MTNPTLRLILENISQVHDKKSEDYSSTGPYENFERAAEIAKWFDDPVDKVFAVLIGVKLARLATLHNKKGQPNNESVLDSHTDLSTYAVIWEARRRDQKTIKIRVPKAIHLNQSRTRLNDESQRNLGKPGPTIPNA
jgi:hypothetical protein